MTNSVALISLNKPETCADCEAHLWQGAFAVLFDFVTEAFICCPNCARSLLTEALKGNDHTFPAFVGD